MIAGSSSFTVPRFLSGVRLRGGVAGGEQAVREVTDIGECMQKTAT